MTHNHRIVWHCITNSILVLGKFDDFIWTQINYRQIQKVWKLSLIWREKKKLIKSQAKIHQICRCRLRCRRRLHCRIVCECEMFEMLIIEWNTIPYNLHQHYLYLHFCHRSPHGFLKNLFTLFARSFFCASFIHIGCFRFKIAKLFKAMF